MREIKFRGKRVDNGEWVYGFYLVAAGMAFLSAFGVKEPIAIIPETVGQFTGLTDKNGKEIYEGDIVRWKTVTDTQFGPYVVAGNVIIEWSEKEYRWIAREKDAEIFDELKDVTECESYEVIGNIYENANLLEVTE